MGLKSWSGHSTECEAFWRWGNKVQNHLSGRSCSNMELCHTVGECLKHNVQPKEFKCILILFKSLNLDSSLLYSSCCGAGHFIVSGPNPKPPSSQIPSTGRHCVNGLSFEKQLEYGLSFSRSQDPVYFRGFLWRILAISKPKRFYFLQEEWKMWFVWNFDFFPIPREASFSMTWIFEHVLDICGQVDVWPCLFIFLYM